MLTQPAEQFTKSANVFFLFTSCIQQIPGVSPVNRWTTLIPLGVVLSATAMKDLKEDRKAHQADAELNSRLCQVLDPTAPSSGGVGEGSFELRAWAAVEVGDVVRVENNESFPADLVLIASSEPEGLAYVETSNLDGETNLKIKQSHPDTAKLTTPGSVAALRGHLASEHPNNSLYTFDATLHLQAQSGGYNGRPTKKVPLSPDQFLARGAQLRNTPWVYGLVVFTGHDTKLMKNATSSPMKRTRVEHEVNDLIFFLFGLMLVLSITSAAGSTVRNSRFSGEMQYLLLKDDHRNKARAFIEDVLTFIIAYSALIPISLIVMIEVVKYRQATFINTDLDMYYAPSDTPAFCRSSSLVEELGMVDYVFSDKTGTLTRNEMQFRQASIGGVCYTDEIDESKMGTGEIGPDGREIGGQRTWHELRAQLAEGGVTEQATVADEFLTLLAVCHTVIPERTENKIVYQASSPDEAALVAGAEMMQYEFITRKPRSVYVRIRGQEKEYEILNVCEFNSTRKRMSTVVRMPDGRIKLFCKGADTVILSRLAKEQPYQDLTLMHLEDFASVGLRTLCIASRDISPSEYTTWVRIYDAAAAQINGRAEALDKAAEAIEKDLFLLGATAIEDKLQDGVPETIHTLQMAGIKVWVLTGDRQETAINIGLSCKLISESMNLVIVNEESPDATALFLRTRLEAVRSQRAAGEVEDLAFIIDGKSLGFALAETNMSKMLFDLAVMCQAVVCCRVSPLQKALVVKLVKKYQNAVLLAIGDGANDVSMIQAAHVGVGISGHEGLQAARSADVAISQFRFLRKLLLVHGSWSYTRLSKMILFTFYKNTALFMTQFFYSFQNSFSGQVAFEGWTLSFYNVVFTLLPPLVLGIFDQTVSARMLDRYPQLYGQVVFDKIAFAGSTLNAFFHSFLSFIIVTGMFWGSAVLNGGYNSYHWIWGLTLFMSVLATVLGKATLVSDIWTKYTAIGMPGSLLLTIIFLAVYASVAPLIPGIHLSSEYYKIIPRLYGLPIFWFSMLLVPIACLLRDFAWKYYRRTYRPTSADVIQEVQKYNLQDYRPRMDQFQKAIRKVRAVQRMRRTRGFAFSQTEGEQARLIRQYDTTIRRPSGL